MENKQLKRDVLFLECLNIMDYSLFVGVHHRQCEPELEEPQEETVEIRPFDDIHNLEMRFLRRYPVFTSVDSFDGRQEVVRLVFVCMCMHVFVYRRYRVLKSVDSLDGKQEVCLFFVRV